MKDSPLLKQEGKIKNYSSYTDKFNIIMMGEEGVGKTDLLKNLCKKKFNNFKSILIDNDYEKSSNIDINKDKVIEKISLEYTSEDKYYLIKIWNYCYISDTNLINDFMKKADAFIIVYSVVDKNSFNNIEKWISEAKNKTTSKNIQFFLIGNNCQNLNKRQVGIDEIKQFAEKDNYKYFEISSFNIKDLENSFNEIFLDIINTTYSDTDFESTEENDKRKCCCCCKKCNIF
jgi:Ras-related protein Rab-8A